MVVPSVREFSVQGSMMVSSKVSSCELASPTWETRSVATSLTVMEVELPDAKYQVSSPVVVSKAVNGEEFDDWSTHSL